MRPGDVLAPSPTGEHSTREPTTEDLHERLHLSGGGRRRVSRFQTIEERAVTVGDGRDVLRLLLFSLDFQTNDPRLREVRELIVRGEVLRRNEVSAVELRGGDRVGEDIVLTARLRARSAVRAPLADHPGHEALAGVRDAERAMHERLEPEVRHGGADGADVVDRVLTGE